MLKELLRGRGAFLELLAAAVVLALGVNVLATTLIEMLSLPHIYQLLVAILVILTALLLIARKIIRAGYVQKSISAVVVVSKKGNELVRIPRYRFSEALSDYLESLFSENEALKKVWAADPLSKQFDFDAKTGEANYRKTEASLLLQEAIEYFVLDRLSTHLTDYFNKPPFDESLLKEFGREDVPSVLFKNRFLDTFSKPMTERPAFVDEALKHKPRFGTVVASFGKGQARYERFDLVLPEKSKVTRTAHGAIEIDTPKFKLHIEAVFDGFGAVLPSRFERLYLRHDDYADLSVYGAKIGIAVSFKPLALVTQIGWNYHMWLDSFLESLTKESSKAQFLQRISWESARTVFELIEGAGKLERVKPASMAMAQQEAQADGPASGGPAA